MLTKEEIETFVTYRDKEKTNLELKSIRLINSGRSDSKEKLACAIAALANKDGGRLILGVNDDGTFDGKYHGNVDDIKSYIDNICRDSISPSIHFDFQFIEADNWDVFVVFVPRRRTIPHAYISNRRGHEIAERVYYTRTPHGKKLMTDIELEWMFKNQEVSQYSSSFRLALEFRKDLTCVGSGLFYEGSHSVQNFMDALSDADKEIVLKDFSGFVTELFPYLILGTLAPYFSQSWFIGMHEEFDRASSGPMITNIPIESSNIAISEIPVEGMGIINSLSWDFKKVIKNNFHNSENFKLPPNTTINIIYEKHRAKIKLKNSKFDMSIHVGMLSGGGGLHHKNPLYEVQLERDRSVYQDALWNFYYYDGAGTTEAKFEFLEYDIGEFKKIEHYYNSIRKLIDKIWNYDTVIKELPHKNMRVMHSKVDDVLHYARRTNSLLNSKRENWFIRTFRKFVKKQPQS